VVKQKSHCEEILATGQGNPNLQWDYCKQGFLVFFFNFLIQEILQIIPQKNSQTYTRKNKSFPLVFFLVEKTDKKLSEMKH
jgi:hypothetical protein